MKIRKLRARFGLEAIGSLILLWQAVGEMSPGDGIIGLVSEDDLGILSCYGEQHPDRSEEFGRALIDVGLVDRLEDGRLAVHDWADEQPYLVRQTDQEEEYRAAQSAKGKRSAAARRERMGTAQPPRTEPTSGSNRNASGSGTARTEPEPARTFHDHDHDHEESPYPKSRNCGQLVDNSDGATQAKPPPPGCSRASPIHRSCRGCGTSRRSAGRRNRSPPIDDFIGQVERLAVDQGPTYPGPWPHPDLPRAARELAGGWDALCELTATRRAVVARRIHERLWPPSRGSPAASVSSPPTPTPKP